MCTTGREREQKAQRIPAVLVNFALSIARYGIYTHLLIIGYANCSRFVTHAVRQLWLLARVGQGQAEGVGQAEGDGHLLCLKYVGGQGRRWRWQAA